MLCAGLALIFAASARAQQASSPGPRWGHVFVYDPLRDAVLLYGGAVGARDYVGDTWIWSEEGWEAHRGPGPDARGFPATAFDDSTGALVLHGGRGTENETLSDTWQWDGARWTELESESPFAADHHEMAYFAAGERMVAFGGWNGDRGDVVGNTWIRENGAWSRDPRPGPPPRSAFGMTYDSKRDRIVLAGGNWIEGQYADVWDWGVHGWTARTGPYDNSSVDHHAMIYDPSGDRVLVFGGKNYRYRPQDRIAEVHRETGRLITLEASDRPRARHSVGLAWDTKRNRLLLYGGKYYQGDQQLPLGDLWSWDGEHWRKLNEH